MSVRGVDVRAECLTRSIQIDSEVQNSADAALYIGVRPSRTSGASDFGHLWLVVGGTSGCCGGRDCERKVDSVPMGRPANDWVGYYPAAPDLPNDIIKEGEGDPVGQFYRYFRENPIPGARWVDRRAMSLATRFPEQITWIGVFGSTAALAGARKRAHVARGAKTPEGRSGLDTDMPGVNNCVSWAANEVVNPLLPEAERFHVDNPPKLRSFMEHQENARCRYAAEETPR